MKTEKDLLDKYGRETGFKVPDGYFDDFSRRLSECLPEYPEAPKPLKLTPWQRVQPYLYLAAMFLGIWCMMKIFHDLTTPPTVASDEMPESVVLALADAPTGDYVVEMENADEDIYIEEALSTSYENIDDFARDFNLTAD